MIYIFTALKYEAAPLINSLNLKRESSEGFLKLYSGDKYRLVITNPGKISAASAVSYVAGKYGFNSEDILINVGVCAGTDIGVLYWVNKVSDIDTNFKYYPDMIYRFNLPESELKTSSVIVNQVSDCLIDMEGSAICEAASAFLCPHQIVLFKVVSDSGNEKVTPAMVTDLISRNISSIIDSINLLEETTKTVFEDAFESCIYDNLKCSEYMRSDLYKLLTYAKNSGNTEIITRYIEELKAEQKYPAASKKEGKEVVDEIRKRLI